MKTFTLSLEFKIFIDFLPFVIKNEQENLHTFNSEDLVMRGKMGPPGHSGRGSSARADGLQAPCPGDPTDPCAAR